MSEPNLESLAASLGWSSGQLERMLAEARAVYGQTLEEFVRSRHRHYREREGLKNDEIFARLQADVEQWRFRAPELSVRQIRRIIYG